ncbi:TPR-like protein [Fomitiporia mediterranea MF3/22]|uniref:TPR-like protein n=1 Tax=Fomitiporia mediterranea (strain MF3/22) TaxID=694068 RepID=UPI000440732E|nr:TPR-like protein [Fomitiporia mediterranea MF3/22]EJD02310.1 TPR-like protein [Fomitiporia mediterranea MF3/22]
MESSADPELNLQLHRELARKHWQHFGQSGELEELDKAILHSRIALRLCPEEHPDCSKILSNLGSFLLMQFERSGRIEDLEEAIAHHRAALKFCPDSHSDRCSFLANLAVSLATRFEQHGRSADLDEAIEHHRAALERFPAAHLNRPLSLSKLARSLQARFERLGNTADLDEAIECHSTTLKLCPNGYPNRSSILNDLARSLQTRYDEHGRAADLDEAAKHYRTSLELCQDNHRDLPMTLNNLATSLSSQFEQHREIANLNEAIKHHRTALELCPVNNSNRPMFLSNLANSLRIRFERHGQTADIEEAIEMHRAALDLRPEGHPNRFSSLNNLAISMATRFEQHGRTADLDKAIEHHRAALELCQDNNPDRCMTLNNLANSLENRFEQHGQISDLDEAIEYHRAAIELCPDKHSNRPMLLSILANSLRTRFVRHGQTADLNEAIEHHRAALQLRPEGHPNRFTSLNNLASSLRLGFAHRGQIADLDEAIEYHRAALELCSNGHSNRAISLNNLAGSLQTRFDYHGHTADLNEAIEYHRAAVELCPDNHADRPMLLNNLALSLRARFGQHGRTVDLDEAIDLHHAALGLCLDGHHNRSTFLNNLGISLLDRFSQHGRPIDLDEAIKHQRAALELRPRPHYNCSTTLNNLAISLAIPSLRRRFEQYGQTKDLDMAIEHHRTALELCSAGRPDHSASLRNFAFSLLCRFEKFGSIDDFQECIKSLERAAEHKFSSYVMRLNIAGIWAALARSHAHPTASRAYNVAMLLLQRALVVDPTLHTQYDFLEGKDTYKTLTFDAASHAIEGDRLEQAVEILEQGRGLLWSQMRSFRTPLDQLAEINRELADRFRNVSRQLENLATSSTVLHSNSIATESGPSALDIDGERRLFEEKLKSKRQLSSEQEGIINEIRQIPGFENFLTATPFKVLQQAASEGPVVVVNHCKYRSDALIMLSREERPVVCVPLDGEFYQDSIHLCRELIETRTGHGANSPRYDEILRRAMKTLWDRVVSKVVEKLRELGIAEGSRIWWCPTSVLSALPFHAAGPFEDVDGTSVYLLDKYISSYTPTLGALINAQTCGNGDEPAALVIGDTSLPSAREEIRKIKNSGIQPKLLSSTASHNAVIKALQKSTWVHFVCHGNLNPKPFKSSFKLSDRGLTLLDIVQANLPNAQFAFLSACHTAEQPHNIAHDEVLHLAAAMQFSGFRSVIGSMWELLDEDGPFLARTVYEYMCNCDEGETKYKRAAAGLREAAVALKARDDIGTERWVNLIHIGA